MQIITLNNAQELITILKTQKIEKQVFFDLQDTYLFFSYNKNIAFLIDFNNMKYAEGEILFQAINKFILNNSNTQIFVYDGHEQYERFKKYNLTYRFNDFEDMFYYMFINGHDMVQFEKKLRNSSLDLKIQFLQDFFNNKFNDKCISYALVKNALPYYIYMEHKGILIDKFDNIKYEQLKSYIQNNIYYPTYNLHCDGRSRTGGSLQNYPHQFKKYLKARDGYSIVQFDYNAAEARMLAFLSQDKNMLNIFANNDEFHLVNASIILQKSLNQVTLLERNLAKTIFFAFINGMTLNGLERTLKMEFKDVRILFNRFKKQYKEAVSWIDVKQQEAEDFFKVSSLFGRTRDLRNEFINDPEKAKKQASNFQMQAPITDFKLKALINIGQENLQYLLAEIQDNIILEIPNKNIQNTINIIKPKIEKPFKNFDLIIPVSVVVGKTFEGDVNNGIS